jgi:hypothetical protein
MVCLQEKASILGDDVLVYDEDATVVQHEPDLISMPVPVVEAPSLPPAATAAPPFDFEREIRPSAMATMSPETVIPSLASDYRPMPYSLRTASETSLGSFLQGLRGVVRDVRALPWVAGGRITMEYVPGEGVRRKRHRPARPVLPAWYEEQRGLTSGGEQPLNLLADVNASASTSARRSAWASGSRKLDLLAAPSPPPPLPPPSPPPVAPTSPVRSAKNVAPEPRYPMGGYVPGPYRGE